MSSPAVEIMSQRDGLSIIMKRANNDICERNAGVLVGDIASRPRRRSIIHFDAKAARVSSRERSRGYRRRIAHQTPLMKPIHFDCRLIHFDAR